MMSTTSANILILLFYIIRVSFERLTIFMVHVFVSVVDIHQFLFMLVLVMSRMLIWVVVSRALSLNHMI